MDSSYELVDQHQEQSHIYDRSRTNVRKTPMESAQAHDSFSGISAPSQFQAEAYSTASSLQRNGEPNSPERAHGIQGAAIEIVLTALLIVLTMAILSAILLGIIYQHLLDTRTNLIQGFNATGPFSGFNMTGFLHPETNVLWVAFSATKIVTIASWTSTAAPMLVGFLMSLLGYPIAKRFLENSNKRNGDGLPTPFQLNILVSIIGSSNVSSLWQWFLYRFWNTSHLDKEQRKRKHRHAGVLIIALAGISTALLLGAAIIGVDTWLHVTTETEPFTLFSYTQQPTSQFGHGMSPECINTTMYEPNDLLMPSCNVGQSSTAVFLINSTESYKTIADASTQNVVEVVAVNKTANSNGTTLAFLRPAQLDPDVDFQASTIAVATQCQPMSKRCDLRVYDGASTPFNCTPKLYGDLQYGGWSGSQVSNVLSFGMLFFRDAAMTNNNTGFNLSDSLNPFYIATGALVEAVPAIDDPEVVNPMHGGSAFLLNCSMTVYDLQYNYINGTFGGWQYSLANTTLTSFVEKPLILSEPVPVFADSYLQQGMLTAAVQDSAQGIADYFSTILGKTAMSLPAGTTSPRTTLVQQDRISILAARIPKAPLYTLVSLNFLYILVGLLVAGWALAARGKAVDDVYARLSLKGLAAYALEEKNVESPVEKTQDLYQERRGRIEKVAVERTSQGGWRFARVAD